MLGLVIAFFGILSANLTGDPLWDAVATLAIAAVLGATAVFLAIETKGLLVGEAADPDLVAAMRRTISAEEGVERVNELLTMHFGPNEILATVSVDFDDGLSAGEVEATVARLETRLKAEFPDLKRLFLEAQSIAAHRKGSAAATATAG